jgi:GT2 family glycosyltransferase/SAM-dependent methyltransferase
MSVERRAGAPRLIDWSGERCVPWTPDVQVAYEHYHRYLWAAELVRGRRVLDLGSGEGFGSAILAGSARSVLAIDIDPATVEHARLNYAAPVLEFRVGSALDLAAVPDASFDVVVMFEVIEHIREQEQVLDGVQRVLAPDGLLIVSTPDRRLYSGDSGSHNPFHERELTKDELEALLRVHFSEIELWGQRTVAGSQLAALDDGTDGRSASSFGIERTGDGWRPAGRAVPVYLVAIASRSPFEAAGDSYLTDGGLDIVRVQERLVEAERGRAERAEAALHSELAVAAELRRERDGAHVTRRREADELLARLSERESEIGRLTRESTEAEARLRAIGESVTWRAFEKARGRLYRTLGGRESRPARAVQWSLRTAGRRATDSKPAAPALRPISFPAVGSPVVSIIVPVHAHPDLTEACLRALVENTDGPPYEVIVIDDRAQDHARVWAALQGARLIHNEANHGYLRSNNIAAEFARGDFLALLNNDTVVERGWLRAMVGRAESAAEIGVVVPKLIYPDGTLQEAGGIIFKDGTGANFGRGVDAEGPEFNYVREVDYGSGACLLVRTELWRTLGGLDERYRPMYYEDTDLCFAARKAGMKVVYEPSARVVHMEGATAGTDVATGSKRFQEQNRPKFVEKWREVLDADQFEPSESVLRRASDRNRGPHVLVIDHRVPSPDRDSGSLRMWEMLRGLRALGCRVTFLPDNHARWEPYTQRLQGEGVEVLYEPLSVPAHLASIGERLALAIVSRPYVAPRYLHLLREYNPNARIVYDTVDLHYLRERRRAEIEGGPGAGGAAATWQEIELALVRSADVTAVVAEPERDEIRRLVPDADVVVLPNVNLVRERVPPPDGREGLLFVGNFEHLPNVDAAIWLVESVMPHVTRELRDVQLTIAGPNPPPEVAALACGSVDVPGWVEDLEPLLDRARAMVAPLRYGAGMKGKVTQSLAAGLPIATTSIGVEGLGAQDGVDLMIGDDAEGLAGRLVRLYRDDELWLRLSENGRRLALRHCSAETMRERLASLLDGAV